MYKGYLIDLDGTIYLGKQRLPEAEAFIHRLQAKNIPFLFVTNNATKTAEEVQHALATHYNIVVDAAHIYTSGMAAIDYIQSEQLGTKGFLIGESALREQFQQAGLVETTDAPDFVLQALNRQLTYNDLQTACLAIRNGARFITTNIDSNLPTEQGLIPGSGALTACLQACTQVEPIIIGKPSAIIMQGALKRIGLSKDEVVMVGDNYNTDIRAGIDNGIATLLTLTGFTKETDIPNLPIQPTHIVQTLADWTV